MHDELIRQLRAKLDQLKQTNPARYRQLERKIRSILVAHNPAPESSRTNPDGGEWSPARRARLVARLEKRSDVRNPYALARAIEEGRVHH